MAEAQPFPGLENTYELFQRVQDICPLSSKDYLIQNVCGSISKSKTTLRCLMDNDGDLKNFIKLYNEKNDETLRLSTWKVKTKGPHKLVAYYRCQHNTRYSATFDPVTVLKKNPSKRIKNTNCSFSLSIKLFKDPKADSARTCIFFLIFSGMSSLFLV